MSETTTLVDRYFAMWNETDATQRRDLIAQTWTNAATYLDPMMQGAGHDGINAMVEGVQAQFAGHRFRLTGPVDAHHDCVRFAWEFAPEQGPPVVGGTDFGIVAADGRFQAVTGFFDQAPGAGAAG